MPEATGEQRAMDLLRLLQLHRIEEDLYRGSNETRPSIPAQQPRLFGGQVLAQALRASYYTLSEGLGVHSLHGYFLRAGTPKRPVLYEVDRIRDGRSFSTRRVVAIQNGEAIFSMSASFQCLETGLEHADSMPNVPPPDELPDDMEAAAQLANDDPRLSPMARIPRPFVTRSVFPIGSAGWEQNRYWNPVWIKFRQPIDPQDSVLAHCLLAYASDMGFVSTVVLPHNTSVDRSRMQMASLDHALWVHRPFEIGEWLLLHKRTTVAEGARGLVHAEFFDAGGALVASATQEALVRVRTGAR